MIGIVNEIGRTQKGAPYIVLDGQRIYAGKTDISGLSVGMKIDYISVAFGTPGRDGKPPQGLQQWKPVINTAGIPEKGSPLAAGDELRYISNVIGNAIMAKAIIEPGQINGWFQSAKRALTAKENPDQGFLDDMERSEGHDEPF